MCTLNKGKLKKDSSELRINKLGGAFGSFTKKEFDIPLKTKSVYLYLDGFTSKFKKIPKNVKFIECDEYFHINELFKKSKELPENLISLSFSQSMDAEGRANIKKLPKKLKNLELANNCRLQVKNLPKGLKRLIFDEWIYTSYQLPKKLEYLITHIIPDEKGKEFEIFEYTT